MRMQSLVRASGVALAGYLGLIAYAYRPRREPVVAVADLLGAKDRFVEVGGQRLRYQQHGQGKPLVFIHGFAGSLDTWRDLVPLMAGDYALYTLDLLGFGLSDKPSHADYSLTKHGQRIVDFIKALDLHDVTLVGHSMGGVVAAFAALHDAPPQRIRRLALLDPNFYRRNGPPIPVFFPLPRLLAQRFYDREGRRASLTRCYADPNRLDDALLDRYLAPTKTPGAIEALAAFLETPGPATYAHVPAHIRLPTLIVWGLQDHLWLLSDGERLQREIAGSQFVTINNAGHMVQEDQPALLAAALRHFIYG